MHCSSEDRLCPRFATPLSAAIWVWDSLGRFFQGIAPHCSYSLSLFLGTSIVGRCEWQDPNVDDNLRARPRCAIERTH